MATSQQTETGEDPKFMINIEEGETGPVPDYDQSRGPRNDMDPVARTTHRTLPGI
jgi:hypothetical protein